MHSIRTFSTLLLAALALGPPLSSSAAPAASPASTTVSFTTEIQPFLAANCDGCHGADKTSGLSVDTLADLLKGGLKAGPAIVAGHGSTSPLIRYMKGELKPRMPAGGAAVPANTIAMFERWIDQGAHSDAPAGGAPVVLGWPYIKPVRTAPPHVKNAAWIRNPIDNFILAKLESHGLAPAPEASRGVLIRRLYYDLLGLPPSPEKVTEFEKDPDPKAYDKLVDRLLASPHYGERWGRHWLDLARYADSDGYERDDVRPNAWRYRDYVIKSFNEDKPYDRFIKEQIAGDELWPNDPDAVVATGFLRNTPWDSLAFDHVAQRADTLGDITDTTGAVFLGLTVGCARCHNHKYDPIPQRDYYRLQAFFAQIKNDDEKIPGGTAMAITDEGRTAPKYHVMLRGNPYSLGDAIDPGFPTCLTHEEPVIVPPPGGHTTGRRTALANWIASPDNPQTARVMANRIWQYNFGQGIVGTTSDFGKNGEKPSHQELLDWLASTFSSSRPEDDGMSWSVKKLLRLIVTSSTYRQSTKYNARAVAIDPDNKLLWRMNRQRLEGEEIRDAILTCSGRLNLAMGGPGMFPKVSKGVLDTGSTEKWGESSLEDQLKRTIYVFQRRSVVLPLVDVFDGADMASTCPRRTATTIAPQALTLMNSEFSHEEAHYLGLRVIKEAAPDMISRIDRAFWITVSRPPSAQERDDCLQFLIHQAELHRTQSKPGAATRSISNNSAPNTGASTDVVRTASSQTPLSANTGTSGKSDLDGVSPAIAAVVNRGLIMAQPAAPDDDAARRAVDDLCLVLMNTNEFVYVE